MNFNVSTQLKKIILSKGIKISFIAKKMPHMSTDLLSKKLNGHVKLSAEELINICDIKERYLFLEDYNFNSLIGAKWFVEGSE